LLRLSFDIIITQAAASRQGQLTHYKAGSKYLCYPGIREVRRLMYMSEKRLPGIHEAIEKAVNAGIFLTQSPVKN